MKPESILKLENENYNINLFNINEKETFDIWKTYNTYELNDKYEIIGLDLNGKTLYKNSLDSFRYLKYLDLSNCSIRNLSFLRNLVNIEKLILSNNGIDDISVLFFLNKLKFLDVTNNLITDFSILNKIPNLTTLKFGKNPNQDFVFLKELKSLKNLDISYIGNYNYKPSFDIILNLPNLESITLMFNELDDISFLKNSKRLKHLNLTHNKISDISYLSELNSLEKLWLQDNVINDISALKKLSQLQILDLSINEISDISSLENLNKINDLKINNNLVRDITYILKNKSLKRVDLIANKNLEIDFPKEVLDAGWEAIKQYSEKSKENIAFKNVKVLLLGNPNIGKSNLLEYLETNEIPKKNDSTHGVKYKQIVLNEINFHIWDFGGQEYFHATHKLFFSPNALNIVLWGKDIPRNSEEIENQFFDLNYWLRIVEQLNCNSSKEEVLIIENKIDLNNPINHETILNQKELSENYNILNLSFTNFSLLNLKRTEIFKNIFFEKAESIISKFNYPAFYEVFWKRIQELNKDFVSVDEINNRPHKENVIAALKVFHNMGMLLYFDNLIPNKVFCKPQALLDLLYEKVLSKEKKDTLSKEEIDKSIEGNTLELNIDEVIKLLKHFDLVFEIDEEKNTYFIPQYLKLINPYILDFQKEIFSGCNIRIIGDNYLMSIAMLKVFSKYGNYVSKEQNEYRFWRNGIIIKKDNSILMIKFVREKQTIELYQDKENKNFDLQKEVVDFILDLPEDDELPKRNFDNHKRKRYPELVYEGSFYGLGIDMNDRETIRFLSYKYDEKVNWQSNFFSVFVSLNNDYFVSWKELNLNKEIGKIKTLNDNGFDKIEEIINFNKYLSIDEITMMEEVKEGNIEKSVTNIFNAPVTVGNLGDNGKIDEFKAVKDEVSTTKKNIGLTLNESKAVHKWKQNALIGFIVYLLFSIFLTFNYVNETEYIMYKVDWDNFKQSEFSKLLIFVWSCLGIYLFYKLIYDRFLDPSKENAFIDLYRKRKKD